MTSVGPSVGGGPRFSVDPWDPAYGVAVDLDDMEESAGEVEVGLEVPAERWAPLRPPPGPVPRRILFVDGVRRVEGHIWIEGADGTVHGGICASYAAGALRCDGEARLAEFVVGRGVFSASPDACDIPTTAGVFPARVTTSGHPARLSLALQEAMGRSEVAVAEQAGAAGDCDMIVVDGPIRARAHLARSVGLVKTHHVAYLPPEQHRVVAALGPGERTPVFVLGTAWTRLSWYLRLPGGSGSPWAGIVRCECAPELSPAEVTSRADATAVVLPRFASEPHKEPRAPQNLYPIGALERELRRRLGDSEFVYRALRSAAHLSRNALSDVARWPSVVER